MPAPEIVARRLRAFAAYSATQEFADRVYFVAVQTAFAVMLKRVFNSSGTSNVNGGKLGGYKSKDWKRLRVANNRQDSIVDLDMTGTLFGAVKLGKVGNTIVWGFTGAKYDGAYRAKIKSIRDKIRKRPARKNPKTGRSTPVYEVADALEKRYGVKIFYFSQAELQIMNETAQKEFNFVLNKFLKNG